MHLAIVPFMNLCALALSLSNRPRMRQFTRVVYWANWFGVGLGVLFGVSSALELSYSSIEIAMTLLLVVPPAVTVLALRRKSGVADVTSTATR